MKRIRQTGLIILITLLGLFFIEAGLRLGGYGYPPGLYVKEVVDGQEVYVNNIFYTAKYFTPALIRTPYPIVVDRHKEQNTFRIVIAGESAALGDPDYSFGFGRILKVMLEDSYPDHRFEVINTSITAINSHVILPIVKETKKKLDPDLFILFIGNNEVIGPFGPNSVFSSYTPSRSFIRLSRVLNSTRIGMLARDLPQRMGRDQVPEQWNGMEMFLNYQARPGDEQLDVVSDHFRKNLSDICRVASRGSRVILSTVPVNIRDCAPFLGVNNVSISDEELQAFDKFFGLARVKKAEGFLEEAGRYADKALAIDSMHAGAHYLRAMLYSAGGLHDVAGNYYRSALAYDALKFRADGETNQVIREVFKQFNDSEQVSLVDMADTMSAHSAYGTPGHDLFLEHVHFTFDGHYLLASGFMPEVARQLGLEYKRADIRDVAYYRMRLAYTAYEAYRVYTETRRRLNRAPFQGRLFNDREIQLVEDQIISIKQAIPRETEYLAALQYWPGDWLIKYKYALFRMVTGNYDDEVLGMLSDVKRQVPQNPAIDFNIGFCHENMGHLKEARIHYHRALDIFPHYGDAKLRLASLEQ